MKGKLASMLILSILFTSAFAICAERGQPSSEGMERYIPTRLEWLTVEMNARYGINTMDSLEGYSVTFMIDEEENTILIFVITRKMNRKVTNPVIRVARYSIEKYAKGKGWSSWLKVKEEIKLID